jgi:hypothetical protein
MSRQGEAMLKYDLHMEFRCSNNTKVNNRKRPFRQLRYYRSINWLASALLIWLEQQLLLRAYFRGLFSNWTLDIHEYVEKSSQILTFVQFP